MSGVVAPSSPPLLWSCLPFPPFGGGAFSSSSDVSLKLPPETRCASKVSSHFRFLVFSLYVCDFHCLYSFLFLANFFCGITTHLWAGAAPSLPPSLGCGCLLTSTFGVVVFSLLLLALLSVGSTDNNREETHCKSSWRGKAHAHQR